MLMTKQHCSHGQSATAIGLAAGLGGGALLLAIAAAWGVNKASESRAKAAKQVYQSLRLPLPLMFHQFHSALCCKFISWICTCMPIAKRRQTGWSSR